MLNIKSVFNAILSDILSDKGTVDIVNDQKIVDKISGVEFYLYDDYFQITRSGESPVSISNFSEEERAVIMKIKDSITSPEVTMDKRENYKEHISNNRKRLSEWFEKPEPVKPKVESEEDTEQYIR